MNWKRPFWRCAKSMSGMCLWKSWTMIHLRESIPGIHRFEKYDILFQIIIIFFDQSIPTYLNDLFYIIVNILCLVWATTGSPKCYSTLASNWGEPWNKNRFSLTAASDLKRGKHLQPFEKVLSQDWSFDFFSSLYNRLKSPVLTGFTHLIQMSLIAAYFSCKGHLSAVRGI